MTAVLDFIYSILDTFVNFMWGNWMIVLLVGTGIVLSFMTRFIQIRKFILSLKYLFQGGKKRYFNDSINFLI